jgi:hypothetical protein
MALKKQKTMANGSVGEYWKITSFNVNKRELIASFTITLYKNKEYSDEKAPAIGPSHIFNGNFEVEELSEDITALGYTFIKSEVSGERPDNIFGIDRGKKWDDLHSAVDV